MSGVLGMAAAFVEKWFGGPVRTVTNPVVSTVGTSVVEILRSNPDRVGWYIQNRSGNDLAIGRTQGITTATGLLISPSGGSLASNVQEDGESVTDAIFAIASAAGSQVYVEEFKRP